MTVVCPFKKQCCETVNFTCLSCFFLFFFYISFEVVKSLHDKLLDLVGKIQWVFFFLMMIIKKKKKQTPILLVILIVFIGFQLFLLETRKISTWKGKHLIWAEKKMNLMFKYWQVPVFMARIFYKFLDIKNT